MVSTNEGTRAAAAERWMPRLFDLLDRVDGMSSDSTGALMLASEGRPIGTVLVELGRVCWAATPRLRRRLTDLLLERSAHPLERAFMEALFRRCRREGKPLGEVLVGAEMVTRERLREALFLHSSEALVQMLHEGRCDVSWIRHQHAKYSAEFTFSPVEMLCGVGRVVADATTPDSEPAWFHDFDEQLATAVFIPVEDGGTLVPVHARGSTSLTARDLAQLGAAVTGMLDGPTLGPLGARTSAFIGPQGATAVAFRNEGRVVVVLCADAMCASRVFTHRFTRT